jgi:hypothetical protein
MRPHLTLLLLLFALGARSATAQTGPWLRERILQAEDRRAPSNADFSLLQRSLRADDSAAVLQAIRALGRLERPEAAASLIPLGLVDEYRLYINPVLLGCGKPMFPVLENALPLRLVDTQRFECGVVLLHYSRQ